MENESNIGTYASLMNSKVRLLELLNCEQIVYSDELKREVREAISETNEALFWICKKQVVVDEP